MLIRRARPDEAAEMCNVLRRSIAELCGADHHDDPAILQRWLDNKTPAEVGGWIAHPGNFVLVAVEEETVLAVGIVRHDGEITCNYVSPDARFRGVSKAMLAQLEATARDHGSDVCHLISTETAHRLYLSAGYEDCGVPQGKFGTTSSFPMLKRLTGESRTS
ncbi:Ribosomal protein S18 acetylase RimI [Bradyrhizobium sp. NFR13]|nr:GNAT family N-acetyltransferase [Bradyrhizobium sp. NFR13]SFL30824.1 Ribosomal protein S18 acetylase RimI [Bradyrhizobium sp. NFR13]